MTSFKGLGVAMVTPFHADGKIDYPGLQRLTEHLIQGGVDYLVVQGTTGESPVLSASEKRSILDFVLEVNGGRIPVVFGIGGNNTEAVCEALRTFDGKGVSGILSASPYYNKPTQEGIYQHYKKLSEASPLPIIVYNVPGRTGSNISPETTLRLANDFDNIVAVKEASGNMEQIMYIVEHKPAGFEVLSGDDAITLPLIAAGVDGVISVVGNAFPKEFGSMVHKALNEEISIARVLHYRLLEITKTLFVEGNPGGVKEVLQFMDICSNHMRLPLVPVSAATSQKLAQLMKEHNLVKI